MTAAQALELASEAPILGMSFAPNIKFLLHGRTASDATIADLIGGKVATRQGTSYGTNEEDIQTPYIWLPEYTRGVASASDSGAGTASGSATVSGVGASESASAGSASGSSTASGVGSSSAAGSAVGAASGTSTASGVGTSIAATSGAASGTSTVSGASESSDQSAGGHFAGVGVIGRKRRQRELVDHDREEIKHLLRMQLDEAYAALFQPEIPVEVQEQAAAIIQQFQQPEIDLEALQQEAFQVKQMLHMWEQQARQKQIDEDEELLMMVI
ncbi:hypothetical protein [Nitrosovibrio sp. Nv6]|uniref:hypothetical protein n=1 Tax=Nitrosovibrio sp. Nv6 TaxID=1855340 RepID=UPI000B89717E|nr:hypothetical protein [Nitrosovibrio sp. Nv6]